VRSAGRKQVLEFARRLTAKSTPLLELQAAKASATSVKIQVVVVSTLELLSAKATALS
jgi:hypothetical protein